MEEPPVPPPAPQNGPYPFSDFVHLVQKDFYYGRAIHAIVKYGRESEENANWALEQLAEHVVMPDNELNIMGTDDIAAVNRCSNTTKFFMLDFCHYV